MADLELEYAPDLPPLDVTVDKWRFVRKNGVVALSYEGKNVEAYDFGMQERAVEVFAERIQQLEGFIEADPLEREDHP